MRMDAEQLRSLPLNMQEQVAVALLQQQMEAAQVAGRKAYDKEDYGFCPEEITAFKMRWQRLIRDDCTWSSFEEFLKWAGNANYIKGARLRKKDNSRPYGPDNAYFHRGRVLQAAEATAHDKPAICRGCQQETASCRLQGCETYRDWFIQNWNDSIHQDIPPGMIQPKKTVFQYEHPDRVREMTRGRSATL